MTGLYGWKPPSAANYLNERELREAAERAAIARDRRMQESRDWLAAYRATKHQTRFNWSGFSTITKETNDEEVKAGATAQAAEVSAGQGVGDAAQERGGEGGQQGGISEEVGCESAAGDRGDAPSYTDPPF